ncbi:MAG: flagellar hook-basal body complex protein FliE [Deltaproteobacteria bacterium]|nr:flagellar hook-basal body complex protein FliE [Deltaproteobacteria bacterium]
MKIDQIHIGLLDANKAKPSTQNLVENLGNSFGSMLEDVNQAQLAADQKIEEFATSGEKDIHGTMIAMEKADVTLKMMLQVRSKLTNAYHELMRMQF